MEWTRERVWERLVEAYDTERRLPGENRFTTELSGSAFSDAIQTFSEAVGAEATRDKARWHPSFYRLAPATGGAVDRMNQTWDWVLKYWQGEPGAARVCLAMAASRSRGPRKLPYTKLARLKGWSTTTMERKRAKALDLMVDGLNADKVPYLDFVA